MENENEKDQERQIIITEHIQQLCKGQDYTISGETIYENQLIKYAAVFDGHGSDAVINFIRQITKEKINEIMATKCPGTTLYHYINASYICKPNESSGSTMCLARIFSNYIEIINIGDSRAVIFKNNKIEFISDEHNYDNNSEYYRIKREPKFKFFENTYNIKMIAENVLQSTVKKFAIFNDGTGLALTQAVGHCGKTGIKPTCTKILFNNQDSIRILLGSDGFFDMIIKNHHNNNFINSDLFEIIDLPGQIIINRAVNRWLQEWNIENDIDTIKFKKEDCDDVSIIVIDIF
jgi:serine/threonine protein phosphatase PrpC